jgi:predicted Fe-Mo cluster-binding NifX family protein
MRIAIPQWQGRIAPVFDVAGCLLLVDVENGQELRREEMRLVKTDLDARVAELLGFRVDVLICGAISAPLQSKIAASGVRVSAFLCGSVDHVLAAYLEGSLAKPVFAMPGCRRWRSQGGEDVLPVRPGTRRRRGQLEPTKEEL